VTADKQPLLGYNISTGSDGTEINHAELFSADTVLWHSRKKR